MLVAAPLSLSLHKALAFAVFSSSSVNSRHCAANRVQRSPVPSSDGSVVSISSRGGVSLNCPRFLGSVPFKFQEGYLDHCWFCAGMINLLVHFSRTLLRTCEKHSSPAHVGTADQ